MADQVTGQDEPQAPRAGLRRLMASLRQPKIAIAVALGIATGMPPVLVVSTMGFWLRSEGLSLALIGFMGWAGIFISVKFLWAPFVDWIKLPFLHRWLGHRRSWMLLGQTFVTLGILGIAITGPKDNFPLFLAFVMLTSFATATQDIAVDAWRIESAGEADQDLMASAYIFGLRSGYFLGSVPVLALSAVFGWQGAYGLAALGGFAGLIALSLAREPDVARASAPFEGLASVLDALLRPLKVFWQDHGKGMLLFLPLVALFFVPDGLSNAMVSPLYIDLGFTGPQIAGVRTVFGLPATLTGVILAGLIGLRFGTLWAMAIAVTLAGVSNIGFAFLVESGGRRDVWIAAAMFEGFSAGMANAAMVAWASRLTNPAATAAQFALLSSLMTLTPGFLSGFSGLAVEGLQAATGSSVHGYALWFSVTPFACVPPLVLIWLIYRRGRSVGGS